MKRKYNATVVFDNICADYVRGLASIHSVSLALVVNLCVKLCMKNHDVFIDFLKENIAKKDVSDGNS